MKYIVPYIRYLLQKNMKTKFVCLSCNRQSKEGTKLEKSFQFFTCARTVRIHTQMFLCKWQHVFSFSKFYNFKVFNRNKHISLNSIIKVIYTVYLCLIQAHQSICECTRRFSYGLKQLALKQNYFNLYSLSNKVSLQINAARFYFPLLTKIVVGIVYNFIKNDETLGLRISLLARILN